MDIVINTSYIDKFLSLPADQQFWVFMRDFGWVFLAFIFLLGVREVYLFWLRQKWSQSHKFVLLAVDIPRGNEQSPKAVENLFAYLGGAHGSVNFFEKWFEGKYQKSISFEIISIEGYTQFLIRTPIEWRRLVEPAIYSQYPDAEISEVDDYVEAVPRHLPDEEYDIWGTEFIQVNSSAYPIKCYQEFEHKMGPSETQFKDPMASLMDLCGSLRQGEQLWLQFIIIPTGFAWVKDQEKEANKILGKKEKVKPGLFVKGLGALGEATEAIYPIWADLDPAAKKEEKPKSMMELTFTEKRKLEAINLKASKLAFEAKIRAVYVAKREVMDKGKIASGLVGYMKQFSALDLNNLKPDVDKTFTKSVYFFRDSRLLAKQHRIFDAYILRSDNRGRKPGIYSIEELATLWHFPIEANVKAAMIQKAPGRKADAPASLPVVEEAVNVLPDIFKAANQPGMVEMSDRPEKKSENVSEKISEKVEDLTVKKQQPPENLPFV